MRREITQLGLTKQVSMLGPLSPIELADLHRVSSACILSSAYEGLPLVILEALACGTPIITTHAGETPRILSNSSGIVCDERSPRALATAIQILLAHPEKYPASSCLNDANPYSAKTVIHAIYENMLRQWVPT